jgi:hypothetical protein
LKDRAERGAHPAQQKLIGFGPLPGTFKVVVRVLAHDLYVQEPVMNKNADPRLVWLASVLAAAVFIVYVTHI